MKTINVSATNPLAFGELQQTELEPVWIRISKNRNDPTRWIGTVVAGERRGMVLFLECEPCKAWSQATKAPVPQTTLKEGQFAVADGVLLSKGTAMTGQVLRVAALLKSESSPFCQVCGEGPALFDVTCLEDAEIQLGHLLALASRVAERCFDNEAVRRANVAMELSAKEAKIAMLSPAGQELAKAMEAHDWYHDYSDDSRVWKRGQESWSRLVQLAKAMDANEANIIWGRYAPKGFDFPR